MSLDCNVAFPRGAMCLFAVCDCGTSWSYSLTIFVEFLCLVVVLLSISHRGGGGLISFYWRLVVALDSLFSSQ